jgi:UDP-N-acetylmuramate dehydrogenase
VSAQPAGTLRGELRHDEPMARHGGWRVGGPARRFYRPADSADLVAFLATVEPGEELHWVGLGSNLLVRDGGIDGTVICLQGALDRIETLADDRVRAEAGATDAAVARHCARAGLLGVEFLAGIPGTLGGALAMNAGAHGDEIWQRVVTVETAGRDGRLRERIPSDYRIAYRSVTGPQDEWFPRTRGRRASARSSSGVAPRSRPANPRAARCSRTRRATSPGAWSKRRV